MVWTDWLTGPIAGQIVAAIVVLNGTVAILWACRPEPEEKLMAEYLWW